MFNATQLKSTLHARQLSRLETCLLCLALAPMLPRKVRQIREIAVKAGVRQARSWNISDILCAAPSDAILTVDGWELTDSGRRRATVLGVTSEMHDESVVQGPQPCTAFHDVARLVEPAPIDLFYSYSHEDEGLRDELQKHLSLLKRMNYIREWHDRRIGAGSNVGWQIDVNLERARIVLLLVSSDFIASDYCYDREMVRALQRHESGVARVLPVILRPVDWRGALFGKLLALPRDAMPVTMWPSRDEGFRDVARGIRGVVEELRRARTPTG